MARLFPIIHELKIEQKHFEQIISFKKTFEIRKHDRDFRTNDCLLLREYLPVTKLYTGRSCLVHVLGLQAGGLFGFDFEYSIMSIKLLSFTN